MDLTYFCVEAFPGGFAVTMRRSDGATWMVEIFPDTLWQAVECARRFLDEVGG
jgi:hypothetical protein